MIRTEANRGGFITIQKASLPHVGIERAVEFIHQNFSNKLTLEETAAQAHLSKHHFSRLFHRIVGMAYQDYVTMIRIETAKELLRQTPYLSMTEIAHEVGFGSLRNFEGRFKRVTGCAPSHYRMNEAQHSTQQAQD